MDQGEVYEGILENNFYFNPFVCGEYQGSHWIEGYFEILNEETHQKEPNHE